MTLHTALLGTNLGNDFRDEAKRKEALEAGLALIRNIDGVTINSSNDFSCTASITCQNQATSDKVRAVLEEGKTGSLEDAFVPLARRTH